MEAGSAQQVWEAALGELQIQVSKANYRTWLEKTVGLGYQDNQFVIGVPNTFVAEYLDQKQHSLIEKTLISVTGRKVEVLFQVNGSEQTSSGSNALTEEGKKLVRQEFSWEGHVDRLLNEFEQVALTAQS